MMVKRKKVSMVVQTKDKDITLDSLRELGLIHLEDFQCSSPEVEAASRELNRAATARVVLAELKSKREAAAASPGPRELTDTVMKLNEEMDSLKNSVISLNKQ